MKYKDEEATGPYIAGIAYRAARWILGVVFIYASIHKILDPAAFARAVYLYQILPDGLVNLVALVLPWVELFLGFLLVIGIWMPGAAVLSTLLFMVFMGALSYNLARGLDIGCGCFSTSPAAEAASIRTVARDGMFLAVSLYLMAATFGTGFLRGLRKREDF